MNSIQITALVIIFLYMAATVAIGLIVSKVKQSKEAKQSNDDFLMASKSLGPVVLAGTLFAANTGGASTTGIATNVYTYGLSACWYVIAAGVGLSWYPLSRLISARLRPTQFPRLSASAMERHLIFLRPLPPLRLCLWQREPRL